ncbi:hypothetical protein [Modestobacter sp. SSW1-42]|uniref:hypothetical protein n=1 Tax=Modestobacter sp. SSW1-42 TaxID=596372 RepID=UPI0039864E84
MRPFLLVLLVLFAVWVVLTVIGSLVTALCWLAVVGLVCALIAARGRSRRR